MLQAFIYYLVALAAVLVRSNYCSSHPILPFQFVFMDMATYEEIRLPRDNSWAAFVTEGCKVMLVLWNGSVRLI